MGNQDPISGWKGRAALPSLPGCKSGIGKTGEASGFSYVSSSYVCNFEGRSTVKRIFEEHLRLLVVDSDVAVHCK